MEPSPQLTDIADAIRLAVTPIFLLAGVGITVNILIARLGRIVDRARSWKVSSSRRQMCAQPSKPSCGCCHVGRG